MEFLFVLLDYLFSLVAMTRVMLGMSIKLLKYKLFENVKVDTSGEVDMDRKAVVITGASRGLGKAMAMELARRNAIVYMGCIDMKEGEKAKIEIEQKTGNQNLVVMYVDMSDMDSVQSFALKIKEECNRVKLLINNAGIAASTAKNIKTKDGFNVHIATNHLGHFLLTNLLLDCLKRASPSRVVTMASTASLLSKLNIQDMMMNKSGFGLWNYMPYANSKFMNVLFTKELGKMTDGTGVTAYALCPGLVRTQIIYENFPLSKQLLSIVMSRIVGISVSQAIVGILHCAVSKSLGQETGKMYIFRREYDEVNAISTDDQASALWDESARLVGLKERMLRI